MPVKIISYEKEIDQLKVKLNQLKEDLWLCIFPRTEIRDVILLNMIERIGLAEYDLFVMERELKEVKAAI